VPYKGLVCIRSTSLAVQLDQNCLSLDSISAKQTQILSLTGELTDLARDSHVLFEIQIDQNVYQMSLVFCRDLNNDSEVVSHSIGKLNFEDMGVISGDRRLSRMNRVFDKHKRIQFPEYFYTEKFKQTESQTVISLITNENGKFLNKIIQLPKVNKVLSIHRQDINFDGKLDYFIYSLASSKDKLIFTILDEKLNPLFKELSSWSMNLTTFEGLPIEGGIEKFEWLKVQNEKLGTILVPSIFRNYLMPEEDNSKIISERVIGASSHQYFLNPIVKDNKVEVELRVVDNVKMMKALRSELDISGPNDTKTVILLKPFPQSEIDSRNGKINSLVVVDEDGVGQLFQVTLSVSGNNFQNLKSLNSTSTITQSLIYPIIDSNSGLITDESIFTTLLNRATAEFLTKGQSEIGSLVKLSSKWENPIIGLIASFNSNYQKSYLVESRSGITLLRDNGDEASLPIYRDSSFPGQSFSESLTPILSQGRPGVYLNSTLIYGDRLYTMVDTLSNGFIRPLRLSIGIPAGCVPLLPETLADKAQFNYVFLCTDSTKDVSLKFLPMSHL
jgi:hypothetical protein